MFLIPNFSDYLVIYYTLGTILLTGDFLVKFNIKIENVVAFAVLGKDIPLNVVAVRLKDAEYSPESFPGVVYRVKEPRAAALIFSTGKIVCTGARTVKHAKEAIHKIVDDIRDLGIDLPTRFRIRVENIVASTEIQARLILEEIAFALNDVEYEPESFPGLVYRIREPRAAFLLFKSGKIICAGARKIEEIQVALGKFKKRLESIGVKVKPL